MSKHSQQQLMQSKKQYGPSWANIHRTGST